jgi:predicted dehydrogenase
MDKVRIGIIGVGARGGQYLQSFANNTFPDAEVTAVCDIDEKRIKEAMETMKNFPDVKYFDDYKEMINSGLVDAVFVETPHYLHPEMSIYALEHNTHVLCEKPAGVYTKQVKEMNKVAEKSDKLFAIMFNQRTNCIYRKMREMIQNGEIGEIRRINWIITNWFRSEYYYHTSSWRATWKGEGGGVLMNQCPHQLDLLQWVTGMMPSKVRSFMSFGKYHNIEVEDEVTSYLEYENGATGVFVTTTAEGGGTNRFEVVGNNGKLVCENEKIIFTKLKDGSKETIENCQDMFGSPQATVSEVETDGENLQHFGIINNFINAILGKEQLFVNGIEGLNGVEIMDAMLLSGFLGGKEVTLPIDDDFYLSELNKKIEESSKQK